MANREIVVTAPYVTMRVRDSAGAWVVRGVYEGARFAVADVDAKSLQHHLDSGLAAYADEVDEALVGPAGKPVSFDESGAQVPQQPQGSDRPHGNASRDTWAAYAASKGAPEDETKPVDEGGLSRDDLRTLYGH